MQKYDGAAKNPPKSYCGVSGLSLDTRSPAAGSQQLPPPAASQEAALFEIAEEMKGYVGGPVGNDV
ncbi:MAG: hypothetical protein ACN6IW_00405 [Paracoccaceae bacterium]